MLIKKSAVTKDGFVFCRIYFDPSIYHTICEQSRCRYSVVDCYGRRIGNNYFHCKICSKVRYKLSFYKSPELKQYSYVPKK